MAKCKCGFRPRIVSNVCQCMNGAEGNCFDVCSTPMIGDPNLLGIMAPLIYDEIGINLCTSAVLDVDIAEVYPTATSTTVSVIDMSYTYGDGNVEIEALSGRPNCCLVTLSNITVTFAVRVYDCCCRLLGTLYPTALYLPSDTTAPTYDEDTNPSSVELELFAPYGYSYDTAGTAPTPVINAITFAEGSNSAGQGINLFANAKLLDFGTEDSTVTIGLTLVLQSMYYVGYKVPSAGKIDIPKGSIITPDNSDCRRFVAGDLLNLAIKPLDLGAPNNEQCFKKDCNPNACGAGGVSDVTIPITRDNLTNT